MFNLNFQWNENLLNWTVTPTIFLSMKKNMAKIMTDDVYFNKIADCIKKNHSSFQFSQNRHFDLVMKVWVVFAKLKNHVNAMCMLNDDHSDPVIVVLLMWN